MIVELEKEDELHIKLAKKASEYKKLEGSLAEWEDSTSLLEAEKASLIDRAGKVERLVEESWASLVVERKR